MTYVGMYVLSLTKFFLLKSCILIRFLLVLTLFLIWILQSIPIFFTFFGLDSAQHTSGSQTTVQLWFQIFFLSINKFEKKLSEFEFWLHKCLHYSHFGTLFNNRATFLNLISLSFEKKTVFPNITSLRFYSHWSKK